MDHRQTACTKVIDYIKDKARVTEMEAKIAARWVGGVINGVNWNPAKEIQIGGSGDDAC